MPDEFGRYQLIELIGRGGMGEVYRAHDTVHDRVVALKVLPDYLAGDESFESRFRRESRMAAKLNEPHIIPIHDFGEIDGRLFLDMRLVEGHDLGSVVSTRGPLPVVVAVELIAQIASALDAAHASGLVHRDVKPSNILLTGGEGDPDAVPFAYLVDFGIARSSAQEGTALTATTATVGTVAYMSPERISGLPSDLRTDVYALACVLHETLTGRKPYEGEMFAQMYAHLNSPVPRASDRRAEVPSQLDAVIAQGMAKDPEQRYASAGALAAAARAAVRTAVRTDTARSPAVDPDPSPYARPSSTAPGHGTPLHGTPPHGAPPHGAPPHGAPPHGTPPLGTPPLGAPVLPPPDRFPLESPSGAWTPPPPARTLSPLSSPSLPSSSLPPPAGPPPSRPPVPPVLPASPARSGRSRRTALIAAAVVVVVGIGAAIAVVASKGGGGASANGSGSNTVSTGGPSFPSSGATVGAGPVLKTGTATTPTVSWAHFAAFSTLLGTRDNDTAAYGRGSCTLAAPGADDSKLGIGDEVDCSYAGSTQTVTVARFASAARLQAYFTTRLGVGYGERVWTSAGQPRGLTLVSPRSGTGPSSLSSSICGLPTYLVQVSAPDRAKVDTQTLQDDTWNKATFPDAVPPACDPTFRAIRTAGVTSPSVGPAKGVLTMTSDVIDPLTQQGDTSRRGFQVITAAGVEAVSAGQRGSVTFWSEADNVLTQVGTSTYPYSASLGPPNAGATGAVLTGMTDATFVVSGTFSGDGSGNAVSYTKGSKGWGAIKAASDGSLKPSGQGVGIGGIGLGDDFALVGGRLQTFDCSSALPISRCSGNDRVIKYWTWKKDRFVQTGSAGRTR